jgi:hypothetical protein
MTNPAATQALVDKVVAQKSILLCGYVDLMDYLTMNQTLSKAELINIIQSILQKHNAQ